MIEMKL